MSDADLDLSLSRRATTFWMTLARNGLDVELWLTRPDRIDFGDGWVSWCGDLPEGGSSFAARWPLTRALLVLRTVPDDDRQSIRFDSRYGK